MWKEVIQQNILLANNKKMRKIAFFISLLVVGFCFSQTKTKYEIKKEQLTLQLFKDLGIGEYELNLIKNEKDEKKKTNMFFSKLQSIPNTYENKEILRQYQTDLQKAQALKTKEDFDKENALQEKFEQERIAEKSKEEIRKQELAKSITNDKIFKNLVEAKMNEWLKKGEFEKEEAVNDRIQNEYKIKFQDICINSAIETLSNTSYFITDIGQYNSEKEYFPTELKLATSSGSSYKDISIKKIINGKIFVPINEAESFKNSFKNDNQLKIDKYQILDFKNFNWKLSEGFYVPTEFEYQITVIDYTDRFTKFYKFQFSDDNLEPILVNANNLDLKKKENVDFDFNAAVNGYALKLRKQRDANQGYISEGTTNSENKTQDVKNKIKEKAKEEGKRILKNFGF